MTELKVGGQPLKATALSLLFYRQEFDRDMSEDLISTLGAYTALIQEDGDPEGTFLLGACRLLWAMSKAGAYPSAWPRFATWLDELPEEDLGDIILEALDVASDGLLVVGEEAVSESEPGPKRLDVEWLAIGKRLGLSFAEINDLRIVDLVDLHEAYFGDGAEQKEATTADIDRLFG